MVFSVESGILKFLHFTIFLFFISIFQNIICRDYSEDKHRFLQKILFIRDANVSRLLIVQTKDRYSEHLVVYAIYIMHSKVIK